MYTVIVFFIFLFLVFYSIRPVQAVSENKLLNIDFTKQARGIAILSIPLTHIFQYIYTVPALQVHNVYFYEKIIMWLQQIFTCIGVGLFLPGFGNTFSIKKNDKISWLFNRLLTLFIPQLILLIIFTMLTYALKIESIFPPDFSRLMTDGLPYKYWVLVFLWYVRFQAIAYVFLWIANRWFKQNFLKVLFVLFACEFIFVILKEIQPNYYFYTFCFPMGCLFAIYKDKIETFIQKHFRIIAISSFIGISFATLLTYFKFLLFISFVPVLACIIVSFLSEKITLNSSILKYMGKYSYEIYIIPFACFSILLNMHSTNLYMCIGYIIFISLAGAIPLRYLSNKIQNCIIQNNRGIK